jgi:hypothetical protein
MTYNTILHLYDSARAKYSLDTSGFGFLKVDAKAISADNEKVIDSLLDIDEVIQDLGLTKEWFRDTIKAAPFNGLTPRQYILLNGRVALLETRIYLTALRYYASSLFTKED